MKILLLTLFCISSFSSSVRLTVIVKNIEANNGSIVLAVFDNSNNFLKKPFAQRVIKADNETMEFSFDMPKGNYAVAIYQDVNGNRELDKSWIGIPKEPYGFSNNFRPRFSAPGFSDCKFAVAGQTTTTIVLKKFL